MKNEIHMYMAVARSATSRYPAGERHPLLIYLRQPEHSGHDFPAAAAVADDAGWVDVDFTKAGILPPDAGEQKLEPYHSCYRDAVEKGKALLVYDTIVEAAPPKKVA